MTPAASRCRNPFPVNGLRSRVRVGTDRGLALDVNNRKEANPSSQTTRPTCNEENIARKQTGRNAATAGPPSGQRKDNTMFRTSNTLRVLASLALLTLASLGVAGAADAPAGVVNLNTATVEQLQLLPGIGPAVAARIVAQRDTEGPFRKAEELMLVRGVGERTFANLEPWIALDGKTTLTQKVRLPRAPKVTKD